MVGGGGGRKTPSTNRVKQLALKRMCLKLKNWEITMHL